VALAFDVSPLKEFLDHLGRGATATEWMWQLGVGGIAAAIAFFTARALFRKVKPDARWKFGEGGFDRVAYPILTYLFVAIGRFLLARHQQTALLDIVQSLLVAWIVIRIAIYILGHVLPPGAFLRVSIRAIAWIAWVAVALHVTGLLPGTIEALDTVGLSVGKDKERITLWLVLQGVSALALTLALAAWISRITESRVLAAKDVEMTTRIVITKAVRVVTLFVAILIALPLVGIPLTALSVFSGALGVGLGFGLQKVASNYVSGFIVLLDRGLRIGDLITVDNRKGEVKAIEARFTVIKGGDGVESIIPNEKLITEIVNHHTYSDQRVTVVLTAVVAFESDIDAALGELLAAAKQEPRVLSDPLPYTRVKALRDHGVEIELTAWIENPASDGEVRSDLYRAILARFRAGGVQIAYPRHDVRTIATTETQKQAIKS
jgi:small-conductance mechanosensitive channel